MSADITDAGSDGISKIRRSVLDPKPGGLLRLGARWRRNLQDRVGLTMGFVARGRWGGHERNPPVERLSEILQELDIETEDFEHPDVSLKHETEWCLSAFLSGLLIWENVGDASEDADPIPEGELVRHMKGVSRQKVLELWLKLAAGDIAAVDAEPWLPGSH